MQGPRQDLRRTAVLGVRDEGRDGLGRLARRRGRPSPPWLDSLSASYPQAIEIPRKAPDRQRSLRSENHAGIAPCTPSGTRLGKAGTVQSGAVRKA